MSEKCRSDKKIATGQAAMHQAPRRKRILALAAISACAEGAFAFTARAAAKMAQFLCLLTVHNHFALKDILLFKRKLQYYLLSTRKNRETVKILNCSPR